MRDFKLRLDLEKDAFADGNRMEKIAEFLDDAKRQVLDGYSAGHLFDTNGNRVGQFEIE